MRHPKIFALLLAIQLLTACGKGDRTQNSAEPDKDQAIQAMKSGGMSAAEISALVSKEGDSAYSHRFVFKFLTGPTPYPQPESPARHARVIIFKDGSEFLKGETDESGRITFLFSEWGELPAGIYGFSVDYFENGGAYPSHCFRALNNYDGSGYWIRTYLMALC